MPGIFDPRPNDANERLAGPNEAHEVIAEPEKWTCEAIAKRFPTGRMKMEYTASGGH